MFGYRWSTAWLVLALWGCSKDDTKATPERVASAKASGSKATLDGGFRQDVEEGIRERSQPWNPPSWD